MGDRMNPTFSSDATATSTAWRFRGTSVAATMAQPEILYLRRQAAAARRLGVWAHCTTDAERALVDGRGAELREW